MKRKLRIEELSVTSFSTDDGEGERGTVQGHSGDISFGTCPGEMTCGSCLRTCADTCGNTCSCPGYPSCVRTCDFTCYASCPGLETLCNQVTC